MAKEKRHLPVLQNKPDDEGEERPPWQWSVLGGATVLLVWVPLAYLAALVAKRVYDRHVPDGDPEAMRRAIEAMPPSTRLWLGALVVLGPLVAAALASFAGGVLVGRFGGRAGKREALVGGLGAAAVSVLVSAPGIVESQGAGAWLFTAAFVMALAAIASWLGGRLGVRLRK
jgi:hypothetical protein